MIFTDVLPFVDYISLSITLMDVRLVIILFNWFQLADTVIRTVHSCYLPHVECIVTICVCIHVL